MVGAGLFVKGFRALLNANASSVPQTLLTFNVMLPQSKYGQPSARLSFFEQTLQRLSALPEVQSASVATGLPYSWHLPGVNSFSIENRADPQAGETRAAMTETVTPNYFQTMSIALRNGRLLSDADTQDTAPVAVISESLARRYFPGEDPLGRRIKAGKAASDEPWRMIVGVVGDIRYNWVEKDDVPTLYLPLPQAPPYSTAVALRVQGDPLRLASAARAEVAAVDPELPLFEVMSMERLISYSVTGIAYVAAMMGAFGGLALFLASIGLYGVIAYSVGERTHEIGMRMALGARPDDILRLVVRDGMFLAGLGLLIGFPVSFGLARALSTLLFGVSAADPVVFVGLPILLMAIAFLASYLPARRAMRVDPIVALRYE
jgi:putative ABC transport system permease protein